MVRGGGGIWWYYYISGIACISSIVFFRECVCVWRFVINPHNDVHYGRGDNNGVKTSVINILLRKIYIKQIYKTKHLHIKASAVL